MAWEILQWQENLLKKLSARLFEEKELSRETLSMMVAENGPDPDEFNGSIEPPYRYSYADVFRRWVGVI